MKELTRARSLILTIFGITLGLVIWMNMPVDPLPANAHATRIAIDKDAHTATLYDGEKILKVYKVALGTPGPKVAEYDGKTPDGNYFIQSVEPQSTYHMTLPLNYPTVGDMVEAAQHNAHAGGIISLHGVKNGWSWLGRAHRLLDWTDGSIAVTNVEIEEIVRAVPTGTPVSIWE